METRNESLRNIISGVVLAPYTSWKVGGPAEFFFEPVNYKELSDAVSWAEENKLDITVLGGGSNILIPDEGIKGIVLHLSKLNNLTSKEENGELKIAAQAGVPKSELGRVFLKKKLSPAIFLAGLPGDVGGGVVMNAGVSEAVTPREFVEITEWIEVLDLKTKEFKTYLAKDLTWKYRKCSGWEPGIVVQAGFRWPLQEVAEIVDIVFAANRQRMQKQPLNLPSCGSVFKNPSNDKAGRLIDACGLKGYQVGQAQVSPKHANFIVNLGGAKSADIIAVIKHIQAEVKKQTGISLEPEVKLAKR